jgi:CO/xanthine dehydrogenase FAD-binding subunit
MQFKNPKEKEFQNKLESTLMNGNLTRKREYHFPSSVAEAIDMLSSNPGKSQIIAGGTDLISEIRLGKNCPHSLIDITRINGLDLINVNEDYIELGAAVTFAAIKNSAYINQHIHALADAAASVGAVAIQNSATWIGNIVQAMPAADGAIIAIALGAEACLVSAGKTEWIPVESLFLGPGISAVDPTQQFITHIRFSQQFERGGTAWQRIGRRPSLVLPILNCAVSLQLDANFQNVEQASIALGPVALRPYRAHAAEEFIRGKPISPETFAKTACLIQQKAQPRDSIMRASREYRLAVIPTMIESALNTAVTRAMKHTAYQSFT